MATTTTNFGWDIPQSTDLVKDGATAIAALGQDIDTALVDLKGGTTGQVLAKASNTDLDYTWTSPNPGDITAVTAGTGITGGGTSGDVTVSFDQANFGGGQYAAGKNKIINGDFKINQRSFSTNTSNNAFTFDRWLQQSADGTVTTSAQTFTAGTAPVAGYEATSFLRINSTGQTASNTQAIVAQRIESVRTFANQNVTISFWAKAASGTPKVSIELNQNFGSGGSPSTQVNNYVGQVTLSTSWARYSVSISPLPTISGKTIGTTNDGFIALLLWTSAGSDYNARTNSLGIQTTTIDFWGVQAEYGSTATPFQTASGGSPQAELAMCQRYYWRATPAITNFGVAYATNGAQLQVNNPVPMRVKGSSVDYSGLTLADTVNTATTVSSLSINSASTPEFSLLLAVGNTPVALTQFRSYYLSGTYLGVSAEL